MKHRLWPGAVLEDRISSPVTDYPSVPPTVMASASDSIGAVTWAGATANMYTNR